MISHEMTSFLITLIFVIGYVLITIEHYTKINKATVAILMAILCWVVQFEDVASSQGNNIIYLGEHLSSVSQVVFFLFGALTVVETINVHKGFRFISDLIVVSSKKKLLWTVGLITFFLSSILDNLTTTIVMVALLRKLVHKGEDRLLIGGAIVIAANAGGAFTPIGDVTTTMLWIGGQISTVEIVKELFLASFACLCTALFALSFCLRGNFNKEDIHIDETPNEPYAKLIFLLGVASLVFVPIFKVLTGLPPFMGILFALGVLWLITDLLHRKDPSRDHLKVPYVLSRIDQPGIFFFFGILLCIDALQTAGILDSLAHFLSANLPSLEFVAVMIGLASAVVDNVPLVAATMSMYDLAVVPQDSPFWQLTAYAAGTGGSILVIGSAAGVVFMGLENVSFVWFFRRITAPAAFGYFAGIFVYYLQQGLLK